MADWVTISALATAGGTLVLAGATFASVRSANRAARVAEESLLAGIRPLLMPSRLDDAPLKVSFADNHVAIAPGGGVGNGIAVLDGWRVELSSDIALSEMPPLDTFRRLTRDIYVASGDVAFWQGAFRDPSEPEFAEVGGLIMARERVVVDLLYADHQGGQRVISRFSLLPRDDGNWLAGVARHWNVDRPDPR